MYDEPNIIKELKEAERLGKLRDNIGTYSKLETTDDKPGENLDGTNFLFDEETAVNKNESNLGANPNKYFLVTEKTSDLVALASFTLTPKFIYVNPSHKTILGYENAELIGKPCLDFIHPEDRKKVIPVLKRYLGMKFSLAKDKSEYAEKLEYRLRDKFGNWHYLETTANTIGNELLFVSKDVTERKKIEQQIQESQEKYKRLFDSIPDLIIETDDTGNILVVNQMMAKSLGFPSEKLIGKNIFEVLPKEIAAERAKIARRALEERKIIECEDERAGRYFHNIYVPVFYPDGKKTIQTVIRDVTEQKKAEEKIKASEEKLRDLFENVNDLIQSIDSNGRFIYVNKKWLRTLGYTEDEVKNLTITDILRKDQIPHCMEIIKEICNGRSFDKIETIFVSKDGREVYVEGNANAKFEDGKFIATRSIFRDVTERKKIENEIKYLKEYTENILESNPNPMIVVKGKQIEYVNKSFISTLGKNKNDYLSKNLDEVLPDCEKIIQDQEKIQDLKINGKIFSVFSFRIKKAEAEEEEEEEERKGIILHDITERKKAEEKYKTLFNTSRDAIMTIAPPTWKFTSGNAAALKLFRAKNEQEFTAQGPWSVSPDLQPDGISSSDKAKQMIQKAMEEGSNFFEWTHKTLDDKTFPATVLLTRVEIEHGKPFIQATVRDITEQKKIENRLKEQIEELERYKKVTVDRELKMIELKSKMKELQQELNNIRNRGDYESS